MARARHTDAVRLAVAGGGQVRAGLVAVGGADPDVLAILWTLRREQLPPAG